MDIYIKPPVFKGAGDPIVFSCSEEIDASCQSFLYSIIAKFHGRLSIPEVKQILSSRFQLQFDFLLAFWMLGTFCLGLIMRPAFY